MTGNSTPAGGILLIALLISLLIPVAGAQVTRGQTFTVTVIGLPRTAYDLWPEGTHDMSGEPGDQPPIIPAGQVDVVRDPPGGPSIIGNHPVRGGGTILDDVPPDSSTTSSTSYYAEVTTDASGHGVVQFRTSSATATDRQFHITAENPANLNEDVGVVLGLPPTPAPVIHLPLPTTMEIPFLPLPTKTARVTPVPTTPVPTPLPPVTPIPEVTPVETTPVQEIPLPAVIGIAAAGIGIIISGRIRKG
jgi:hypothetical protein